MAFKHGSGSSILCAEYDLSPYLNATEITTSTGSHDTTDYASSGNTERNAGLKDASVSLGGFFDATMDGYLPSWLGAATGQPFTVTIGDTAIGARVRTGLLKTFGYNISTPVGDMVAASITLESDGGFDAGVLLHALGAETTSTSAASQDNAASTANGGVAVLHCTVDDFTTLDVKVEHSANDSTWADLATFTQLTGVGSQRVLVAAGTTVDRYLRATWTIVGTSGTFAVSFARR